jgi:penicillin-binding protein 1A
VVSRQVAYQITSMLEGVIERGTGRVVGSIEKPLAGKSGTSNDFRDAWFVGYSPQLVVAVYIGRDDNESLGQRESGGRAAAPVFRDVMAEALEGEPARPFQVPPGIRLVRINAETGERAQPGDTVVITEAFKAGESPREPGSAEEERELMDGLY